LSSSLMLVPNLVPRASDALDGPACGAEYMLSGSLSYAVFTFAKLNSRDRAKSSGAKKGSSGSAYVLLVLVKSETFRVIWESVCWNLGSSSWRGSCPGPTRPQLVLLRVTTPLDSGEVPGDALAKPVGDLVKSTAEDDGVLGSL
jgi:hypothetical protein